jgi:hypothetical protein
MIFKLVARPPLDFFELAKIPAGMGPTKLLKDVVPFKKTRLKILPVLSREHYASLLHWV